MRISFSWLPEGVSAPDGLPASITVLHKPVKNIYLVATSAMDDFIRLDALDSIALSGTKETGWYLPEAENCDGRGKDCLCRKVQRTGITKRS